MPFVIVNESFSRGVTGSVSPGKDSFLSTYTFIKHVY